MANPYAADGMIAAPEKPETKATKPATAKVVAKDKPWWEGDTTYALPEGDRSRVLPKKTLTAQDWKQMFAPPKGFRYGVGMLGPATVPEGENTPVESAFREAVPGTLQAVEKLTPIGAIERAALSPNNPVIAALQKVLPPGGQKWLARAQKEGIGAAGYTDMLPKKSTWASKAGAVAGMVAGPGGLAEHGVEGLLKLGARKLPQAAKLAAKAPKVASYTKAALKGAAGGAATDPNDPAAGAAWGATGGAALRGLGPRVAGLLRHLGIETAPAADELARAHKKTPGEMRDAFKAQKAAAKADVEQPSLLAAAQPGKALNTLAQRAMRGPGGALARSTAEARARSLSQESGNMVRRFVEDPELSTQNITDALTTLLKEAANARYPTGYAEVSGPPPAQLERAFASGVKESASLINAAVSSAEHLADTAEAPHIRAMLPHFDTLKRAIALYRSGNPANITKARQMLAKTPAGVYELLSQVKAVNLGSAADPKFYQKPLEALRNAADGAARRTPKMAEAIQRFASDSKRIEAAQLGHAWATGTKVKGVDVPTVASDISKTYKALSPVDRRITQQTYARGLLKELGGTTSQTAGDLDKLLSSPEFIAKTRIIMGRETSAKLEKFAAHRVAQHEGFGRIKGMADQGAGETRLLNGAGAVTDMLHLMSPITAKYHLTRLGARLLESVGDSGLEHAPKARKALNELLVKGSLPEVREALKQGLLARRSAAKFAAKARERVPTTFGGALGAAMARKPTSNNTDQEQP